MLRLGASIRAGTVPHSVILKKLAAFPRQNALHRTLREVGRLERAIFTCDWLLDPELRRRSHGNPNKGESRRALARAVFFHRLGELRDRTAEDMAHRASGLNLVANAIVLWNTTYLARAVAYVRNPGHRAHGRGIVPCRPAAVGPHRAHRRLSLVGRGGDARALPAAAHQPVQARGVPGFTGGLAYMAAEAPTHPLYRRPNANLPDFSHMNLSLELFFIQTRSGWCIAISMTDPGDIVPFPVSPHDAAFAAGDEQDRYNYSIVHRSRRYSGELLISQLSAQCVQQVSSMGSCTLQALWDEVVRRWPEMADEIVAKVETSAERGG